VPLISELVLYLFGIVGYFGVNDVIVVIDKFVFALVFHDIVWLCVWF